MKTFFTPLEKAAAFKRRSLPLKADGGLKPPSAPLEIKFLTGFTKLKSRMSIVKELLDFCWQNKLWWMIPIIFCFLLLGILILFTQSAALTPMIYALF